LGRVARRILRDLPAPVVVVPPDWEPPAPDPGPVVVASNLQVDSVHAVKFAAESAERLALPLVLIHVVPLPHDYGAHYLPTAALEQLRRDHEIEGGQRLAQFARDLGLSEARQIVCHGGVVDNLVRVAHDTCASLVVTGSRRLSAFERLLLTSIGSELCTVAPCAVAVVPPADADDAPED
jgi:nucleotide-binding universal stress UspA family protein